jgi:hypothetical protein
MEPIPPVIEAALRAAGVTTAEALAKSWAVILTTLRTRLMVLGVGELTATQIAAGLHNSTTLAEYVASVVRNLNVVKGVPQLAQLRNVWNAQILRNIFTRAFVQLLQGTATRAAFDTAITQAARQILSGGLWRPLGQWQMAAGHARPWFAWGLCALGSLDDLSALAGAGRTAGRH